MDSEELYTNIQAHLHQFDEVELLLLKGHLILEQVLNYMLASYFPDEQSLQKLSLSFFKKLELLKALDENHCQNNSYYEQLIEINHIRNKLAHTINFSPYRKRLEDWACSVVGYRPKTISRKSTYKNTVLKAFYMLSAFLTGYATGMHRD